MMNAVTLNDILYVVLTAAVPLVLRYVAQLVSAKVQNSKYESAVNAVLSAVEYVNQTYVDALKKAGQFDNTAQAEALMKAKEAALAIMDDRTREWIAKTYVGLDKWLTVQIEATVKAVK